MAKNPVIDATEARRLLVVLDLEKEAQEEEITWALSLIRQIPGYQNISLAKAAQDKGLREILIAIASEQIAPTAPSDLENLMEKAEKSKRQRALAKEKGEKETEEYIEAAKRAKKEGPKPKEEAAVETEEAVPEAPAGETTPTPEEPIAPVTAPTPVVITPRAKPPTPTKATPEGVTPSPTAGVGISLVITDHPVPVSLQTSIRRSVLRIANAPFNLSLNFGGKDYYDKDPERLTAATLLSKGITASKIAPLKQQALAAGFSESQWGKFTKTLAEVGTSARVRTLFGRPTLNDVSEILFNLDVSISRTQVTQLFLVSSADRTTMVMQKSSFIGGLASQVGQRILGRVASHFLEGLIGVGAVATGVATETIGAQMGAAVGSLIPGVGIIGGIIGAIVGFISTKVISLIQKYKDYALPTILIGGALLVGGLGLTAVAIALGALGGLALLGKGAGGLSGAGVSVGGFGSAILYGITHVVLPSIAIPVGISLMSLILIFSLIYFIITTGAFVMPGGQGGANLPRGIGPGALGKIIPAPEKGADKLCLPINGHVTQGAFCEDGVPSLSHCAGENAYDIGADLETPIYAVHDGRACAKTGGVYGNSIELYGTYNGQEVITRYAHMLPHDPTFFPPGTCKFDASGKLVDGYTEVTAGSVIGQVGNSGLSKGAHLHFGLVSDTIHIASVFGKVVQGQVVQNCFSK